ncbi:unnamed protein product [Malus baccata var. baccata]
MASNGLPSLGRVKLTDLAPAEGLPSESYKLSVSTLSQSLALYSQLLSDGALLRSGLDSARFYFHQKASYPAADMVNNNDPRDWCKTSGYNADPQLWLETYDYRPGFTPLEPDNTMEFPPAAFPDIFSLLAKAARDILHAISFYLNLRSSPFTDVLDNVPLRNRPSFQVTQHHSFTTQEDGQLVMFSDHEHQVDKSLISLVKSDKAGLHIKDFQGRWVLVDEDLGPQEAIVYPGLALYQAIAGYVNPALQRMETANTQSNLFGRCSLAFKFMPKSMTNLSSQFQLPVAVDDFMQRSHPTNQLFNRHSFQSSNFHAAQDGSMKPLLRRRKSERTKPLPPSKRLWVEAQRVLKERVQDIADKKGIKLRFCNLKKCENHIQTLDSTCANIRMEIGWPNEVPFVHSHDLPDKAKIGFLEAYEPGWTATHDMELSLTEPGQAGQSTLG